MADFFANLHPFSPIMPGNVGSQIEMLRGSGCWVSDRSGTDFLDAAAGLWCVNVGHGCPEVIEAITRQAERISYFPTFNNVTNEPVSLLADKILELAPPSMRRVFFGNSGSDANDTAIKIVWMYQNLAGRPGKKKIIARRGGYHGVTVAAGSLTGLPGVHRLFDLPLDFARHVGPPDLYRAPEKTAATYAEELDAMIRAEGADTIAAFIAEPVIGTGGVLPPPDGYYQAIKQVLDTHDVLLVLDEVITGFGRLGSWFGADHFGVTADLIVTAKGLTSSYVPMSAVLIGARIWDEMEQARLDIGAFGHGFTTTGHPLAAAAALANLAVIERDGLIARAGVQGDRMRAAIEAACGDHVLVGNIRSTGLMLGMELVADRATKTGFSASAGVGQRVYRQAVAAGLLVRALPLNDVIALSPPFTISDNEIGEIAVRLRGALDGAADSLRFDGLI